MDRCSHCDNAKDMVLLLIKEKQALVKKNKELRAMIRTIYLLTRPRKKEEGGLI